MAVICFRHEFFSTASILFVSILLVIFQGSFRAEGRKLVSEEVATLKVIASKIGIKDWNFSVDPCSQNSIWARGTDYGHQKNVTCDCSFMNGTICHISSIALKSQNLTGLLPVELKNLAFLKSLDLARNYISGTLPASWASLPLVELSLFENRIFGRIPKEIGNITTLETLVLDGNKFEGTLPPELGNLTGLKRLSLISNNFTGELPSTFVKFTNMSDFRITGSDISGRVPEFIGNWTKLQHLMIMGTYMEGPLPSTISSLVNMIHLRVSDLNGRDSSFPPVQTMKKLQTLILRNCSISGEIPVYLGSLNNLKMLDLSFNNFTGNVPPSISALGSLEDMFLRNNKLTGPLPDWIYFSKKNLDLSENTFTNANSSIQCPHGNVDIVSSFSYTDDNSVQTCLKKDFPCSDDPAKYSSLFINCGGREYTLDGIKYEADTEQRGESMYFLSPNRNWAFTSMGKFMNADTAAGITYIVANTTQLHMVDPTLYMTARTTPITLTYYGLCLQNGIYNVSIHFSEIMFTDDLTFTSLGERLFDVSIQHEEVLKNFNIEKESGGTGRELIKSFNANVTAHTLQINFYWAGKGTLAIPSSGVYGPLVSAISVTPKFRPINYDKKRRNVSILMVVLVSIASCIVIFLLLVILRLKGCLGGRDQLDKELRDLKLKDGYFSLKQLKIATCNFDPANRIGEGGFGPVYKGTLTDGRIVAVKQLSSRSKQGNREFFTEISMISALQHPNLVKLFGCCVDNNQLMLIYEYMENNSLARALFGPAEHQLYLDWETRCSICIGIAKGLAYLHEESRLKIVHRDIKATNVLLDKDLTAKISDFGLAKLHEDEHTHISTRIAGTIGYMAPEYATRGYLTEKADVYSFGVVLLETVSGQSNATGFPNEDCTFLLDRAYVLQENGQLLELVDHRLGSHFSSEKAIQMLHLALLCTSTSPSLRPKMSIIVDVLEGRRAIQQVLKAE